MITDKKYKEDEVVPVMGIDGTPRHMTYREYLKVAPRGDKIWDQGEFKETYYPQFDQRISEISSQSSLPGTHPLLDKTEDTRLLGIIVT